MQTDANHWPDDARLDRLIRILRQYPSSITAWSGGVDSTLVAVVAARVHGPRALAVTGISPSLAASEEKAVRELGPMPRNA